VIKAAPQDWNEAIKIGAITGICVGVAAMIINLWLKTSIAKKGAPSGK